MAEPPVSSCIVPCTARLFEVTPFENETYNVNYFYSDDDLSSKVPASPSCSRALQGGR